MLRKPMDPLITNGIDPALLRVLEKRGEERDPQMRRRRAASPAQKEKEKEGDDDHIADPPTPRHEIDDLA